MQMVEMAEGWRHRGEGTAKSAFSLEKLFLQVIAAAELDGLDRGRDDDAVHAVAQCVPLGQPFDEGGEFVGPVLDGPHGGIGVLQQQAVTGEAFLQGLE